MRLYLVRHGETVLNSRRCYYGDLDVDLNKTGLLQAAALGGFFRGISLDYVISSPLLRCVHTAEILLEGRKVPLRRDERLKEQSFGIFEGLTAEEIASRYAREWQDWNTHFAGYCIPGGESFLEVRARVDRFVRECCHSLQGTVLITAHKGTLGHMLASLLSMPPEGYWNFVFDQGCYSLVDVEDGFAIIRGMNIPIDKGDINGFI